MNIFVSFFLVLFFPHSILISPGADLKVQNYGNLSTQGP